MSQNDLTKNLRLLQSQLKVDCAFPFYCHICNCYCWMLTSKISKDSNQKFSTCPSNCCNSKAQASDCSECSASVNFFYSWFCIILIKADIPNIIWSPQTHTIVLFKYFVHKRQPIIHFWFKARRKGTKKACFRQRMNRSTVSKKVMIFKKGLF